MDYSNCPVHGGNRLWAANIAGCSPEAILDFSASINPLGPPQSALAAIKADLTKITSYPDPDYRLLKTALGEFHQLPPDFILPGNGVAELLTWVGWELASLEATYLITPAFSDYWRSLKAFQAKVLVCPLSNLSCQDLDILINNSPQQISPSESGLLLNNPHNPTGQLFLKQSILPFLEQFALVVIDEAFMNFLPPEQQQSLIEWVVEYPNLVILRSLTKFYSLPGLRLGYAIAQPEIFNRWQKLRDPWSVNILAVAAGLAVIEDTTFRQKTWTWLAQTKPYLYQSLAQIPGLRPLESAANYLLVKTDKSSSQLQRQLLQSSRILIRDCLSFPELGESYFRIAVRTQSENQKLIDSLSIYN